MINRSMGYRLWLFRHGKSDWSNTSLRDFDRPLAPRGIRDAQRMGNWLENRAVRVDVVCCSPAQRARMTLARALTAWNQNPKSIRHDPCLYGAGGGQLLQLIRTIETPGRSLMLVGHNPGLDDLLEMLVSGDLPFTASGKLMTTANIARIDLHGTWARLAQGDGQLRRLVRPKELDAPSR